MLRYILGLSTVCHIDSFMVPVYGGSSLYHQSLEQISAVYGYSVVKAIFYCILQLYTAVNTVTSVC